MTVTTTILPWRNASELAFVRDCFYPNHAPPSAAVNQDVYSVTVASDFDPDAFDATASTSLQTQTQRYRLGLKRIEIWNFRSPRSVPHAVAATAALVEARMYDEMMSGSTSTGTVLDASTLKRGRIASTSGEVGDDRYGPGIVLTESALKSIYAMAFLRFVNGFVDRDVSRAFYRTGLSKSDTSEPELFDDDDVPGNTAKSVGENSMYAFAASIGMPSTFVDLRHRCVHGSVLPDLSMLRRTSEKALEWLWERWWKGNAVDDSGRWLWERSIEKEKRALMGSVEKTEGLERMEVVVGNSEEGVE